MRNMKNKLVKEIGTLKNMVEKFKEEATSWSENQIVKSFIMVLTSLINCFDDWCCLNRIKKIETFQKADKQLEEMDKLASVLNSALYYVDQRDVDWFG